jgi:hypothetical protein
MLMHRCKWTLVFLTIVASAAWAQTPAQPVAASDAKRSAEEEAEWVKIRALKSVYEDAVSNNQIEKLRPYVATDFHGVLVTGAEARSFDELLKRNQEIRDLIGTGGSYQVKLKYDPGTMFGNIAVANGTTEEVVVTGSGKRFAYSAPWLVNLIKENGVWKLYRFQSTIDPVDNVFVHDTLKYTGLWFGGGGLLIGALLGFLLRGFLRR